jgi:WD40 repeat protein
MTIPGTNGGAQSAPAPEDRTDPVEQPTVVLSSNAAMDFEMTELGGLSPPTTDLAPNQSGADPSAPRPARPLAVVPGYEIISVLGHGGMGVVYKARQLRLNRMVALKMVSGGTQATAGSQARFQREAEAVAQLDHPHIVPIYEVGEFGGQPYFTMKLLEGGSLERRSGPRRDQVTVARLTATVARAVHYAHQRGILHRDLKPSNILFDNDGQPYVTDFGLAKRVEGDERLTDTGAVLGTPGYMAPEQANSGKPPTVATDVWGMGAILFELMTGRPPFQAATQLDAILQLIDREAPRIRTLNASIDKDLETICLKCLTKDPRGRYSSAEALAEDLERWLLGEPILARPVGMAERTWRWARRRPAIATLALILMITMVGGTIGITAAWLHALAGWQQAREQAKRAEAERENTESTLYFSRIAQANLQRQLNHPIEAEYSLDACVPRDTVDRRGWEWHYLKGVLHADFMTIPLAHEDIVSDVAFSPDGQYLATAGGMPFPPFPPGRVRIWQVWGDKAGLPLREFPNPKMIKHLCYPRDGRRILWAGNDKTVCAGNLDSGQVAFTRPLPEGFTQGYFSPSARYYASFKKPRGIGVWEVASGKPVLSEKGHPGTWDRMSFGPDDRLLAVSEETGLRIWEVPTQRELIFIPHDRDGRGRSTPAFSPDSRLVALGMDRGTTRIWEVGTGRLVESVVGHAGDVRAVAFSPDGDRLATAGSDATVRMWDTKTWTELLLLRGHVMRASCLGFHPSGRYLASGGEQPGDVKIWDVTRPQEYVSIPESPQANDYIEAIGFGEDGSVLHVARQCGTLQSCESATGLNQALKRLDIFKKWMGGTEFACFSPDSRRLAAAANDSRIVNIIDVATGEKLHTLEHDYTVVHITYSRDGRRLASVAAVEKPDFHRTISVWDAENGRRLTAFSVESHMPVRQRGGLALSPDGERVVYDEYPPVVGSEAERDKTSRIVFRDASTGKVRQTLDGVPPATRKLAYSPDGRYLAMSFDDDGVLVYDCWADLWLHRQPLRGSVVDARWDLAFRPDGRRLAGTSREDILLWDVETGQQVLALRGAPLRAADIGFNPHVVWSPDGRRLAASNWNFSISIWDSAERSSPAAKQALYEAAEKRGRQSQ